MVLAVLNSCSSMVGSYQPVQVSVEPTSKTFEVDGSKDELYVKANKWMVTAFNNAKSVIQFSDKEAGVVTGKYLIGQTSTSAGYYQQQSDIFALITVEVKDGATKITLSPQDYGYVEVEKAGLSGAYSVGLSEDELINKVNGVIDSYQAYLNNKDSSF